MVYEIKVRLVLEDVPTKKWPLKRYGFVADNLASAMDQYHTIKARKNDNQLHHFLYCTPVSDHYAQQLLAAQKVA